MKHILIFLTCLLMLSPLISCKNEGALAWKSPTEERYREQNPKLYETLQQAKALLDGYGGDQRGLIKAKQLLDEIVEQRKDFAPAYREYARLYYKTGYIGNGKWKPRTLSSALAAIKKAIRLAPDYEDAYVLLGYHYVEDGLYKAAEKALDKAEEMGSKLPWLYLNRVPIYKKNGDKASVLAMYERVIEGSTENQNSYSFALSGMAAFYRDAGDYSEAKYWFEKQIDFNPTAWGIGEYARYLLFWRGDADNSIRYGEQAIAVMNYGVGRYNLACAYYLKWSEVAATEGDKEARQYFERAYELFPDYEKVGRRFSRNAHLKKAGFDLLNRRHEVGDARQSKGRKRPATF
ncbi:MAG: hypothetical protein V7723_07470 [Sneathiella sp.]|uniref:tetratricopeptide repeat protein n=1 Tax=Sneathiella sp. TaxID=1964365 RepID=UPI003001CAE1